MLHSKSRQYRNLNSNGLLFKFFKNIKSNRQVELKHKVESKYELRLLGCQDWEL